MTFEEWWKDSAVFHKSTPESYREQMTRYFRYAYQAGAEAQRKEDAEIAWEASRIPFNNADDMQMAEYIAEKIEEQ